MSTEIGSIHYDLDLNDDKFQKGVKRTEGSVGRLKSGLGAVERSSKYMLTSLGLLGAGLLKVAKSGLKTAADFETTRSALIGLLGSAEEADKTIARIKQEAATTPFELVGLTEGVKQLSSVVETGDEAIDILLDVGKAITASGGGQEELDRVVFNLKQIQGIGELSAIDLKELRRAIPIFDKLVEAAGTTVTEIQNAKDPAAELFRVFQEGGANIEAVDQAFTIQGGNMNQLLSNLKDNWTILISEIVTDSGIFDIVKQAIDRLNGAFTKLSNYIQENGGVVKALNKFYAENKEKIDMLAVALVSMLIPAVISLTIAFIQFALPLLAAAAIGVLVWKVVQKIIEKLGGLQAITEKVKALYEKLRPVIDFIKRQFELLWIEIKRDLIPALQYLWATISPYLIPILKVLATIIGVVVVGAIMFLVTVIRAIVRIITWWVGEISNAVHKIRYYWETIKGYFYGIPDSIKNALSGVYGAITGAFSGAFNWLSEKINWARDQLNKLNPMERFSPSIVDKVSKGTAAVVREYEGMFNQIGSMATNTRPQIDIGSQSLLNTSAVGSSGQPINISLNPSGIVARSRSEWRSIIEDGLKAIDEDLRSRGKNTILSYD